MQMLNRTTARDGELWNVSSGFKVWFDSRETMAMATTMAMMITMTMTMMTTTIYQACSSVKLAAIKAIEGGVCRMQVGDVGLGM